MSFLAKLAELYRERRGPIKTLAAVTRRIRAFGIALGIAGFLLWQAYDTGQPQASTLSDLTLSPTMSSLTAVFVIVTGGVMALAPEQEE